MKRPTQKQFDDAAKILGVPSVELKQSFAAMSERAEALPTWIAPASRLPAVGERIVFMAGSGAVFVGEYVVVRDYPKFEREDGHGSYTPKAVRGWMPLPAALSETPRTKEKP